MNLENIGEYVRGINFADPTWDLFVWLFFIIGSFVYGFVMGKDRIVVMLVSIYMSFAVVRSVPLVDQIANKTLGSISMFQIVLFFVLFLLLFSLFDQLRVFDIGSGVGDKSIFKSIVFSILHTGLIIAIILSFLPKDLTDKFSFYIQKVFISPIGYFLWTVMPILALVILSGKSEK